MARDFYEILGVPRTASEDEIRKAYRKLAHLYHPDKTGGDKAAEEKLKEINEAYDVLKNKEKRAQYDQFGAAGAGAGFGGAGGFGGFDPAGSPFDDIFEAFFGGGGGPGGRGGRGRAGATQGSDLEYRLRMTLRDAFTGKKETIRFRRNETCGECNGTGAANGSSRETCSQCHGHGQVRMSQGFFSITRTCPRCQGTGQVVTKPCAKCRGNGIVTADRELSIDIPGGVETGSRLCAHGEGEPGRNGGPRGDLYIVIEVEKDDVFRREGLDIICEVPVRFSEAVMGATIRVPTLEGEADLKVPAGTQSGTTFKLRGQGMPDLRGYRRGDQLVLIQVETPSKLTREQKDLVRRFDELSDEKTYPLYRRFLSKIRETTKR